MTCKAVDATRLWVARNRRGARSRRTPELASLTTTADDGHMKRRKPDVLVTYRAVVRERDVEIVLAAITELTVRLRDGSESIEGSLRAVTRAERAKLAREAERRRERARTSLYRGLRALRA